MERFTLAIEVKQHPLGHFELASLDGPLADKMLCYAMLAEAADCLQSLEEAPKTGESFQLTITIVRKPDTGLLRLERLTGPRDRFFVRGMLELARDGVQAGPKGATWVNA